MHRNIQSVNLAPLRARVSKLGVRISLPKHPISLYPMSDTRSAARWPMSTSRYSPSARITRKLGRSSFFDGTAILIGSDADADAALAVLDPIEREAGGGHWISSTSLAGRSRTFILASVFQLSRARSITVRDRSHIHSFLRQWHRMIAVSKATYIRLRELSGPMVPGPRSPRLKSSQKAGKRAVGFPVSTGPRLPQRAIVHPLLRATLRPTLPSRTSVSGMMPCC